MGVVHVYPDAEAAVRTAARIALPGLSGRVFFGVPGKNPALPLLTVGLVSGGPENGETPLERPRLTFDCWGRTKADASDLRRTLVAWLRSLTSVQLDATTFCYDVVDIFSTWQPDDEEKLARYVVDATLVVAWRNNDGTQPGTITNPGVPGGTTPAPTSPAALVWQQGVPAATWIIPHTFGRTPTVDVYLTSGEQIDPDVTVTSSSVSIVFASPTAGSAVLS